METLQIVVLGLVPMITLLSIVVAFLMSDRKQLTGLIASWRARFKKQSELNQALKAAQSKLKKAHEEKLQALKESQGKQFQLGFSAFLENCQTEINEHIAADGSDLKDEMYRSALQVYASSLDATLNRFQTKGDVEYAELVTPVKERMIEAIVEAQSTPVESQITEKYHNLLKTQETQRIQLRGLIEGVYRDGKVVVKDQKDELVLVLEKQLRDRISQQREMLLDLNRLESELEEVKSNQLDGKSSTSDGSDWSMEMPKMLGS
ncbi:MAG: hypothetical protein CL693_10650 [Cellvibrionaceae bacterium]|nr:hypothetical protein [Cellvibrionaceae bacterium]|tara:strand:+ start:8606 stop:9394 length:789 start_codon:yes stop_codon:yes gene_type:complete